METNTNNTNNTNNTETSDIDALEKEIQETKKFTETKVAEFMERTFELEKKYLDNTSKEWQKISHFSTYLRYKYNLNEAFKSHLLTLISTIFLPLGVIVGFFGMNFKSMGAPSLRNTGIFNVKHAEKVIVGISVVSSIIIIFIFLSFRYF